MGIADGVILSVIAISALLSWLRGFVKEALSLVTWLSALIISYMFAPNLATVLVDYIALTPALLDGAARLMLFVGTLMVGALIKNLVAELIKATGLSKTDRVIGIGFGVVRGAVIVLIVTAGLRWFNVGQNQTWWQESQIIPIFSDLEAQLMVWLEQQPAVSTALQSGVF